MKIYGIFVLTKSSPPNEANDPKIIKYAIDLSSFNFFQRRNVQEFMKFTSGIMVKNTQPGNRCTVSQDDKYLCHVYVKGNNRLGAVVYSDHEYPVRVAQSLLTKILDTYSFDTSIYSANDQTNEVLDPLLEELLKKYQDPKQADPLSRLTNDLDETKVILHQTIESVLERGEKLDDLVSKSDQLSADSKAFYKTAKSTNKCSCVI